jgi:predicted glycosyltransferase involved in capsule biosynthesis|tara:strand:+ start:28624 stop:29562 length:939 start_codon:yes stop_codon:yes gene_type:complete
MNNTENLSDNSVKKINQLRPIEETLTEQDFSFKELKEVCTLHLLPSKDKCDISFIIPVRGRQEFLPTIFDAFKKACEKSVLNICLTVVEHSNEMVHLDFCQENGISYIFIPCEKDDLFNKGLAMNCGAIWSRDSEFLLFHDLDCIMQSDFFDNIMTNLEEKQTDALQTFTKRRVLCCNKILTKKILLGGYDYDSLRLNNLTVTLPQFLGAHSGSVFIKREAFYKVGGYDHTFVKANSPDDSFFCRKIATISSISSCDEPENELFHLNHPVTYNSSPKNVEMKEVEFQFGVMTENQAREFVFLCEAKFKEWRN